MINETKTCPKQQPQTPPRKDVDDLIFREQPTWLASDR